MIINAYPIRKCIAFKKKLFKNQLLRIVRDKNQNILIDINNTIQGRGAYIQPTLKSVEIIKKNYALEKALGIKIPNQFYEQLELVLINQNCH